MHMTIKIFYENPLKNNLPKKILMYIPLKI